jgi:hypothetical protein
MELSRDWWKILLVVVALVALPLAVIRSGLFSSPLPQDDYRMLVDIETGQLYRAKQAGRSILIPAESPESGLRTLFPVTEGEDGGWTVSTRYLPGDVEDLPFEGGWGAIEDPGTGRVRVLDADPVRLES